MPGAKTIFLYTDELGRLRYPETCPLNTSRAGKTRDVVRSLGLLSGRDVSELAFEPAGRNVLERFHTRRYLDALEAAAGGSLDAGGFRMGLGTADCPVFPDMYGYPALAAGGTVAGAGMVATGAARIVFNPSGGYHHAGPEGASGFCYINDVVLGCMRLRDAGMRVLFLDIDVHHGDGVQAAFYDRRDVMTVSLHESGRHLFPGTGFEHEIGTGDGKGYAVNVPLPVGAYDEAYVGAFRHIALPLARAYRPDAVVLEVGMDGLAGDPLAHLRLTNNAHADVVEMVLGLDRPLLVTGGGGYHVGNTVRGWALVWSVLCGRGADSEVPVGLGGVMMQSTEWLGGLRDRATAIPADERAAVDSELARTVETLKRTVFPIHGL